MMKLSLKFETLAVTKLPIVKSSASAGFPLHRSTADMEGCEEQLRKGWKGDSSRGAAVQVLKLPSNPCRLPLTLTAPISDLQSGRARSHHAEV